ncbi:MFS transporter [Salinimicrobium oceani]|uniref:MFS transporter n=1 Tax=Salinimicrobium oceani TaxID=2722702 RepID=A0ABX1CXS2_9FLAO|nr:MFS transporter [Salinimicrobium oceani]NJW52597.1 MFS transporter [Salinimicrobium oceani]
MAVRKTILSLIVISQFLCTSLWFAGNGVMRDLMLNFELEPAALGHLTSAVQAGFILGTLGFAFLNLADRFSPSKVFFYSAIFGALLNLGLLWNSNTMTSLFLLRLGTGISLAGIYPVGMKIASDYYRKGLGTSLGFLVGALVLGTAVPHLLNYLLGTGSYSWKLVLLLTSIFAATGGLLVRVFIPDGPFRQPMAHRDLSAVWKVFRVRDFKIAAAGYFGHMWELYSFWAFVPFLLSWYAATRPHLDLDISLLSFLIIGVGGLACVAAGFISKTAGTKRTAATALSLSGLCCLVSPVFFLQDSIGVLMIFLIFWGIVVVADSPLFSTLVANHAAENARGTALTIVNCIGFAITVVSLQLINFLSLVISEAYLFLFLLPGPLLGIFLLLKKSRAG